MRWSRVLTPAGVLLAGLLTAPWPAPGQPSERLVVELTVLRHESVKPFDNARVKAVFDGMGEILQKNGCGVSFQQKGKVGVFTGPAVIQSQANYDAISNLGG